MKVSIITICYNSEKTIRDTIKSVISQDYPDVEYILVDGVSKDSTLNIIEEYKSSIAHILSEKDKGIYDAMNKGVQLATGDLIGILNSDDFYTGKSVISEIVGALKKTNSQSIYADLVYTDQNDTNKIIRKWSSGSYKKRKFKWGWMPPHPTFFVKREVYEKYGTYSLELKSAADYEFMLRVLYKHRITTTYLPKTITKMRAGGVSNASLKHRLTANSEDRKAWIMNDIKPNFLTLYLKPIRKITQFIFK